MSARDPRWVVLAEDGRYVILGRHREPDDEDIARVEEGLRQAGTGGWLAIMSSSAHATSLPEVILVRPLGLPTSAFDEARRTLLSRIAEQRGNQT